uniref:Uncharacterized protein n=1 Tax=Cannabis sativa TaxID=3483 RepID=A0A803NV20_CANSA
MWKNVVNWKVKGHEHSDCEREEQTEVDVQERAVNVEARLDREENDVVENDGQVQSDNKDVAHDPPEVVSKGSDCRAMVVEKENSNNELGHDVGHVGAKIMAETQGHDGNEVEFLTTEINGEVGISNSMDFPPLDTTMEAVSLKMGLCNEEWLQLFEGVDINVLDWRNLDNRALVIDILIRNPDDKCGQVKRQSQFYFKKAGVRR